MVTFAQEVSEQVSNLFRPRDLRLRQHAHAHIRAVLTRPWDCQEQTVMLAGFCGCGVSPQNWHRKSRMAHESACTVPHTPHPQCVGIRRVCGNTRSFWEWAHADNRQMCRHFGRRDGRSQNESAPDSIESRDAPSISPPPKTALTHLNVLLARAQLPFVTRFVLPKVLQVAANMLDIMT